MLRTDYKDDVFSGDRKYEMIQNTGGTYSFNDVTEYQQRGDYFGAQILNQLTAILNTLEPMTYAEYQAIPDKEDRLYFCTEN